MSKHASHVAVVRNTRIAVENKPKESNKVRKT